MFAVLDALLELCMSLATLSSKSTLTGTLTALTPDRKSLYNQVLPLPQALLHQHLLQLPFVFAFSLGGTVGLG
jgi:hypothetical protein